MTYDIVGVLKHEEGEDVLVYLDKEFATREDAVAYINEGEDIELWSQSLSEDTQQDPDLEGYWLDDFDAVPSLIKGEK